jgi:chemotaxis protein methyltransferase CheR
MEAVTAANLSPEQFSTICTLVHRLCGINLRDGKEQLVTARLNRRLRANGMDSYDQYLRHIQSEQGGPELAEMIDALTTNKTSFFREPAHFEYLQRTLIPQWAAQTAPLRLWSAGCSSGEEPYSIAMTLRDGFPDVSRRDIRILATDLSQHMLDQGELAQYTQAAVGGLAANLVSRHFQRESPGFLRVRDDLRSMVQFAQLNLQDPWPMKGPFAAIFCRNVMIYFDKATQQELIPRFHRLLAPGGHLFIGHSESLSGIRHDLRYIQPAVYRKEQ